MFPLPTPFLITSLKYLLHFLSTFTPNLLHFKNLLRYFAICYDTFSIFPSTLFCCEIFFSNYFLTVIIIRLGKETEEKGIFDYLKGLFTGDIKRIQRYSHIEWSEPFQEEASKMTGFGDMIYERGIQQGMQQGIQQGRHEGMILGALMSGKTPEEVSKMLNLPLEEIKKVQEQQMTVNK